ncbi:MAG: hypothetical protein WD767_06755 [Alphaproteobacteria bacterium]
MKGRVAGCGPFLFFCQSLCILRGLCNPEAFCQQARADQAALVARPGRYSGVRQFELTCDSRRRDGQKTTFSHNSLLKRDSLKKRPEQYFRYFDEYPD